MKAPDTGDIVRGKSSGRYYVVERRLGRQGRGFLLAVVSLSAPSQPNAFTTSEVEQYRGPRWTGEDAFQSYFQVADELDGGLGLDDLDAGVVWEAKVYADERGASWPPYLAEAEEIALDRAEVEWRRKRRAEQDARTGADAA